MENNKFNPEVAKELYNEAASIGKTSIPEEDFYQNLGDSEYARMVYRRYKDKYGVNLLGAEDDSSFLGSLGYTTDYVGNKPVEKKETTPKQEKPVRIPNIRTVKDDDTGEDVYVDIDIPKTPDMTLKLPNSMDRFKQNPLEDNLVKKVFGVESLADVKNPQERLQEQIAQLGKDKEEVRYDDEGNPFTVKIADSHKDLDIERIKNIRESIAQQQAYDRKINDEFVKKYELLKSKLTAEENYSPKESWAPRNLKPKNITEEDKEFLRIYADKYNKIKEARKALDNQSKFAKSYAQLAEYDASVEKGEQMSAMVAKGEISEDDMDILRSSKSQAASQQYIERQVKNGRISRVTANKLYEMGDLTERDAFSYGFTKTGNLEDLITFGITEIVRNFDVAAIANKVKNGQKLTDEEANVISMYGKMSDMLSEAKQDARGWQFTAGQGMQKTLLFIAEMGMTGGVSGLGKTFGKEAAKALVRKYGLKKASGIIAKQTGKRLAQSAKQQLFLTPLTPAAYVDYSDRVLKMTLDKPEVTTKDKIAALYKSYAQIWAERFSESLGDIVVDVPVGGLLSKTSFYKKAIEPVANIFNKITELPGYKNTSKTLRQFGVDNMPVEIFEETINPFLYSVATAFTDTKEIEQIDGDFFRQVALTSAILGGFHGALGYTVGASTAAIESKRIDNAYSDIMSKISKMKFLNKNMESLREELVVALNRQNYIESESGNKGRTVGQILGDMNAEMQSFAESDRNLATYKYDRRVFEAMDYASRVGAYKYGSNLGIKGEVSARLGRAKDEDGNIIPMDFEHKDGNVYEASVNGQNYFILDESNDAVVVVNRETGEKEILNKNVFDTSTITQTNANDWAMNTYLLNFNNWKAQDSQTQNQQTQQGQPTTPPTHVVLRGEQLPIKNIDPETGDVTITDNTGDELTIPANDPEIELVYPTQQEEAPVQQEETPQPVAEENAPIEEPVAPTEEQVDVEMQEPEYVAPRSEDNDIVWNEVPAERFKQVIDEEVGADYADGYIDMRIEDAQRKLNEHNEKQKPIASGEYKAFMEESKKLESDLAYWTNAKQEYANAVAQEVAAQNEVETLLQDEANEVAPESTVMYDAKQQEQVEAEAPVQVSKEELDSTVAGWKTNGVNVNVVNSIDEITNEQVLADINKGVKVTGWYDTKTGEVYVFAPNITDTSELDSTVIHEVVAHKGLRGLVGEKYYQQFCEKVFSSMSKELQDKYLTYPGVNGNKAAAADEYIAYLAEKEDLTAEEQSIWDKIIQFFREYFDARLVGILKKDKITDADIAQLIRMSYANIKNNAKQDETTEDTAKQELNEEGFETDNTGTVRFSVKYVPDESLREKIISNLMAVTGDTREKVEKWLESELSLANIINDEMNRDVLDYEADDRYGAIKKNSDYPQGTVDFNNICRKRLDFTNIYKQLQSAYPNRIFTAEDLEAIRQTMIEDGLMVACGLCYVEDRRQLLGEIANDFIENLKNGTLKENIAELLDPEDTYIPTIADLLAPEGSKEFYNEHPALYNAFVKFNNARGQQAGRLFEGYAEYKREILKWNDKKVKSVNNVGGLRIFSFSDFEAHHLIDIVQIVIDAASKGVMIQGYTKVPTFARAMRNTGIKINRSLIPEGNGIKEVDGQLQLAFDPVEGIDVNDKDFLDEESNPNIGNVLVGINEEQIRMAMTDAFVDYIIPFHSGIRKDILDKKKIGHWVNYKNSQREKDLSTGKSAENGINIYTDVLQAAEAEGKPIKTKKQFVNKFLAVCKERGLEPRFSQFLDKDAKGNYVYTEGYHKFLVDFKLFDKKGKILPQQPVVPVFDNAFNAEILNNYVEDTKTTKEYGETVEKIKERLGLENNPTDPNDGPRYRVPNDVVEGENAIAYRTVTDQEVIKALESSPKKTGYRNVVLNLDGTFGSPMASGLRSKGKDKVRTTSFEIGKWEQAEENPQLANEEGKITLVKPDGKSVADVDYNPYIHNRLDTVNAQFKQAWERPNLVYIETEVATTDLESGYKAEKAAKPVGVHKWNNGDLMLSRYDKPIRIVPWSEVADDWVERFKDRGVEFDIVPPALLPILTMRGVNILPPHKGMGKSCNDAYAEWQKNPLKKKEGIITDEQIEQLNKQYGVNTQENQEQTAQADTKENVGRTTEQKQALFDKAKEVFGTTNNFKVAGYMLPDGSLLDFSGRWEGGPGDARYTDHRAIGSGLYEASETDSNYDTNMYDFINQGAIRLMPESAGIYVSQPLTEKQEDRLASYIYRNNGEVILEIIDNDGNSISYIEYNRRTSPEKVLSDISNYFEKGIEPVQPDIRYRSAQPFYSNAEMAVQGVKQDKATQEQWLAMLTKNGGLKAGEDRWLGLSDWLKEQKGSVTKQEILDYINANKIEIEEVNYSENPTSNEREILSIRLDYTTDGLENKREIALVVPNIKSYEEYDYVHFGDAGNGKAIAWVRFGDLVEYDDETGAEERVLIIDEIQSKRHQDARENGYGKTEEEVRNSLSKFQSFNKAMRDKYGSNSMPADWNKEDQDEFNRLRDEHSANSKSYFQGVPAAPFEKNWHELAMKRMLRYAAENGYAKIAWTTGSTQAERYGLGGEVDSITSKSIFLMDKPVKEIFIKLKNDMEEYTVYVDVNGDVVDHGMYENKNLAEILGKNIASKLLEQDTVLSGDGLVFGGEGMRGFYDKMLVDFMNKYGKKWGVKVSTEMTMLGEEMHIIDVTDAMVRSVMDGQPMFRVKSDRQESIKTRQRAENIMKDAIAPMATELGVEVNYVTSEDISDVEPRARKKRQSKGWYQDGKVYINLSTHETIDDARETYLHEVVAHYGLRGLLKDQFEPVMQKVFASLTPTQQQSLLEIFADEVEAAEEFLASMAENDTDPDIVDKVIGFIRDTLRSMGINLDNYTNSDLMYLLWRSKNNLKENAGHIETAIWEAKDTEVRYRTFKNGRLSANSQYGTVDRLIEKAKDTVWSVKLLQDEIVARGGFITDTSDPYGQSTLMPQRSAYEIDDFNKRHYKPMLKTFSKAAKMLAKRKGISVYDANDAIEDFLYARHAIERNRKLAIDKMYAKATGMFADLTKEQREQLKEIAEALYDANYSSSPVVVEVVPYPNSNKLALSINGLYKDSHFSIDEFDTIKTAIDEWTAENPEVNESGLTDKQAQDIIDDVYVNQSAQMQDMLDEVSTSIKDCTKFILDKWLEYGMISNSDYNKYLNQYDYYIPLRGWDETSDIEYEDVAGNEYNKGETLISLNRQARGRKSKADSPLAFIAQMATSAIVYGNKNRLKQMAFNMIRHNYDLIQDLVFIEDDDKLTHKTKSEIKAHEVQLKNNGRTVRFSFQKNFGVGVAAATAIKGDNVQNITNPIMRAVGGATRLQSRLRTSLNPVFMVVNGVRDYFFGNLSYFIKYGIGDTIELNKNYVKGFACAFLDAAGKPLGNSPLRQMYEEYKREGGQTGYIHLDDIKRLKRETRKIQRRYQNGWNRVSSSVLKLPSYILRLLGEPGENAMRFAAYKTLRDKGVSSRQAAKAAKEITVNFNRTGTSKWPGMLWGFYNATLEGTANYFRMGFNKETAARFWMTNAALAAVSYVMAGWAKGFGDDDDDILEGMTDEERAEYLQQKEFANEYNRISNYVKRTNILIPMMGDDSEEKKFIAIPLPQSFRMASALGITLRDIIENNKNALDELEELAWFAIGEVQPFDIENISIEKGDGFLSNLERVASPSIVLPWLEVEQNRNFMGNPIYKESYVNESYNDRIEPSYTIAGNQTPEFLIATAKEINEKLGGTEYMAAKENEKIAQNRQDARGLQYTLALMADAADPASVDHILKGTLGGFYELGVKAIDRYNSEEENIAEDWILADRFIKSATRKPGAERYYERKKYADELERLMKNEKKNAKKGEANQYLNSPHHQELVKVNKYWKKRIKDITDKISMYKKGNVVNEEKITELKEQRDALVLEAALAFERLERKYKEQE